MQNPCKSGLLILIVSSIACGTAPAADLPENAPIPELRPREAPLATPDTVDLQSPDVQPTPVIVEPAPAVEKEDPAALRACLAALDLLQVRYKQKESIDDGEGCGIDRPLEVTSLGEGVALTPPGQLRCQTALELAHWTHEIVAPMLKTVRPDETLSGLDQASAYVCRKRNSAETGKISEHARGNAVDIAAVHFKSGKSFSIEPRMQDSTLDGAFQRAITAAACLYFTTVLDPGSDKAHETHLHLDILQRKAGYRYCW